jgi:hypothetical protein
MIQQPQFTALIMDKKRELIRKYRYKNMFAREACGIYHFKS